MKSAIINILLFALFVSCGANKSSSKAKLNFGENFLTLSASDGGVYVYGKNVDTQEDFALSGLDLDREVTLNNGKWHFIALAWDGAGVATNKLEGSLKCAQSINVLNGQDTIIDLTFAVSNCLDPVFGNTDFKDANGLYQTTDLYKCGDDISLCNNSTPLSAQIILKNKDPETGSVFDGITTRCLSDSTAPATSKIDFSSTLRLPIINMISSFKKFEVKYYSDTGCANLDYTFIPSLPGSNYSATTNGSTIKLTTLIPICETTRGKDPEPFNASGINVICSKENLQYIGANSLLSADIKFLKDIDLGGQTFNAPLVSGNFTANIYGEGHRIFNGTLDGSGVTNNFGIFQQIGNSGAETIIENLSVEQISLITPYGYPGGVLAGNITGKTELSMLGAKNIQINVTNSSAGAGTIAGMMTTITSKSSFSNYIAKVSDISIEADSSSFIGSIFGKFDTSGSTLTSIHGIFGEDIYINIKDSTKVGGLVGAITQNGYFSKIQMTGLKMENKISPDFSQQYIGGIFGIENGSAGGRTYDEITIFDSEIGTSGNEIKKGNYVGAILGGDSNFDSYYQGAVAKNIKIRTKADGGTVNGVGGLFGSLRGNINGAIFNGEITTEAGDVGGIVGEVYTQTIEDAKSFGKIICPSICGGISGKAMDSGANYSRIYSKMEIYSSGNTVGGLIAHAKDSNIDVAMFEGYLEGTNTLGGAIGKYQFVLSNAITSISNLKVDAKLKSLDSSALALAIGQISTADNTQTLNYQNFVLSGQNTSDSSLIVNAVSSISGTIISSGGNCFVNYDSSAGYVSDDVTSLCQRWGLMNNGSFDLTSNDNWTTNLSNYQTLAHYQTENLIGNLENLGFVADPYLIGTKVQWNQIKDHINLMKSTFVLTSNIDFSLGAFNPIGSSTNPFTGNFIGNGYTLKNIDYTDNVTSGPLGIFRVLGPGARINDPSTWPNSVQNLQHKLTLSNISFDSTTATAIGSLAGYVYNNGFAGEEIIINNITLIGDGSSATIELSSGMNTADVGGMFGLVDLKLSTDYLANLKVLDIDIEALGPAGGIIGRFTPVNSNVYVFSDFRFRGTIGATQVTQSGVGGLIGEIANSAGSSVNISRSSSNATITASNAHAASGIGYIGSTTTVNLDAVITLGSITGSSGVSDYTGCMIGFTQTSTANVDRTIAACSLLTGYPGNIFAFGNNSAAGPNKNFFYSYGTNETYKILTTNLADLKTVSFYQANINMPDWTSDFVIIDGLFPYLNDIN